MTPEEQYGVIKAPDSPLMARAAEMFRGLERRVEGSPAEFMLPGSGIAQVLERKAYGEDPSAFEYAMAGLDATDIVPGAAPLKAIFAGISAKGAKAIKDRVDSLRGEGLEDGQDLWNAQKGEKNKGYYDPLDKKFRFEINTQDASLKNPVTVKEVGYRESGIEASVPRDKKLLLSEVVDFPELFEKYPDLKNINVEWSPEPDSGFYSSTRKTIGLGDAENKEELTSTLLHEIQHVVQETEGFLGGGSRQMFKSPEFVQAKIDLMDRTKAAQEQITDAFAPFSFGNEETLSPQFVSTQLVELYDNMLDYAKGPTGFLEDLRKIYSKEGDVPKGTDSSLRDAVRSINLFLGKDLDRVEKFLLTNSSMLDEFQPLLKKADEFEKAEREFRRQYRAIPGEIEASNVQVSYQGFSPEKFAIEYGLTRDQLPKGLMNMSPAAIKQNVPYMRGLPQEQAVFPLVEEFRNPLRPQQKAEGGGVQSLSPIAKNMYRGYDDVKRGVGSYMPHTRYSRRP